MSMSIISMMSRINMFLFFYIRNEIMIMFLIIMRKIILIVVSILSLKILQMNLEI